MSDEELWNHLWAAQEEIRNRVLESRPVTSRPGRLVLTEESRLAGQLDSLLERVMRTANAYVCERTQAKMENYRAN